ncbi:hypothetical protein BD779DRAFT_1179031 [Infundibulicybe gibba]|nr:hypothetical protein BD779DRAFT_1179031 [Infundibulicybe gibba]
MPSISKDVVSPAFGDPAAGGQAALVKPRMTNAPMILALVAAGVLSLIFLWFFVSFLQNRAANAQKQPRGAGEENQSLDRLPRNSSLPGCVGAREAPSRLQSRVVAWRAGSHGSAAWVPSNTLACFARNSLIPNFTQMVSPPAREATPRARPRYRTNDTGPRSLVYRTPCSRNSSIDRRGVSPCLGLGRTVAAIDGYAFYTRRRLPLACVGAGPAYACSCFTPRCAGSGQTKGATWDSSVARS